MIDKFASAPTRLAAHIGLFAPRWPQDSTRWLHDGPTHPRWPRMAARWPKMAARWLREVSHQQHYHHHHQHHAPGATCRWHLGATAAVAAALRRRRVQAGLGAGGRAEVRSTGKGKSGSEGGRREGGRPAGGKQRGERTSSREGRRWGRRRWRREGGRRRSRMHVRPLQQLLLRRCPHQQHRCMHATTSHNNIWMLWGAR